MTKDHTWIDGCVTFIIDIAELAVSGINKTNLDSVNAARSICKSNVHKCMQYQVMNGLVSPEVRYCETMACIGTLVPTSSKLTGPCNIHNVLSSRGFGLRVIAYSNTDELCPCQVPLDHTPHEGVGIGEVLQWNQPRARTSSTAIWKK